MMAKDLEIIITSRRRVGSCEHRCSRIKNSGYSCFSYGYGLLLHGFVDCNPKPRSKCKLLKLMTKDQFYQDLFLVCITYLLVSFCRTHQYRQHPHLPKPWLLLQDKTHAGNHEVNGIRKNFKMANV